MGGPSSFSARTMAVPMPKPPPPPPAAAGPPGRPAGSQRSHRGRARAIGRARARRGSATPSDKPRQAGLGRRRPQGRRAHARLRAGRRLEGLPRPPRLGPRRLGAGGWIDEGVVRGEADRPSAAAVGAADRAAPPTRTPRRRRPVARAGRWPPSASIGSSSAQGRRQGLPPRALRRGPAAPAPAGRAGTDRRVGA